MIRLLLTALAFSAATVAALAKGDDKAELWAASANNIAGWVEARTSDHQLPEVIAAFEAALKDLGYFKTDARVKTAEAVLAFRGPEDVKISVKLKQFPEFTNIKVRCGLAGNDALSRVILERVYQRL